MDRNKLIDILFEKAKDANIEDMEVHIIKKSSTDFNVYEKELEKYVVAEEELLSIRGIYKGKMGYSYTEKLKAEDLDELIRNLIQYAENNSNTEVESIASPVEKLDYIPKENLLDKFSEEEKIEYLLDLEKRAYNIDPRVKSISNCSYSELTKNVFIKNTKGLELEDSHVIGTINLGAVVDHKGDVQTGYSHHVFNELKEEYKDLLIRASVQDALDMLGAKSISPGNYKVILRNNVAADIFSSFMPVFLGSTVQKNLSLMKGKLDSKVAVDFLNIIEDPLFEEGNICRRFDDEGTLTYSKHLIQNGVLKNFLHNNKTGEKEGIASTGNGFKDSHKSSIGVVATNIYIEDGNTSLDEMIQSMDKGVVITDIHGLHAGINPTSGDFSLSSVGLLIEKGEVVRPLSEITVAGNLYKMLNDIESIGNDRKFSYPGSNYFGSPSIKIKSLAISGKWLAFLINIEKRMEETSILFCVNF